jgi:dsDNA-specific endonuclease/ATPase MutS2
MTKSEEIQVIREAILRLGSDSYLGPWLADQMPSIESALASDYPPETYALSIHEARIHCEKLISQANDEAATIEKRAKFEAEKLRESACKFNESIRADLKRSIESALQRIERY